MKGVALLLAVVAIFLNTAVILFGEPRWYNFAALLGGFAALLITIETERHNIP